MKKYQSSVTAEGIAVLRAMESEKPPGERVCYDPYAKYFPSPALGWVARFFTQIGYAERRGPGVHGFLVARTRYIDDDVQRGIEDGIEQLVILGAGFDSRAYRLPLQERVRVFEVDHPATQQVKKAKLTKIFGALPSHVVYVPVDFETESLEKRLAECGYDPRRKTLFVCEGLVYYLTPEAVDSTLAFVANHSGAGSRIIFDYLYAAVLEGRVRRGEASSMRRYRGLTGEGWHFAIEEGHVDEFLSRRGFDHIQNVTSDDLHRMYFTGVNARRTIAPVYAIVSATVRHSGCI